MDQAERNQKMHRLQELRQQVALLESELASDAPRFVGGNYYTMYYATAGFFLGMIAAVASLLVNVIGAPLFNVAPLRLIEIYLTFPLGEESILKEFNNNLAILIGICLYVATGMILGIVFHLAMTRFVPSASLLQRMGFASVLAIVVWAINFYAILSWLQPLLFGGNWIVEMIPVPVAIATHLVFGLTMALLYPLGLHHPYHLQTEQQ
jgi:tetrahydromethanopterin S-methyltransferase subunit G